MQRLAYFREPRAEAHAWSMLGDAFLEDFYAYNDFHDRKVTARLIEWLERRGVSMLVLPHGPEGRREADDDFIRRLAEAWLRPVVQVSEIGYRIAAPPVGSCR
jgi:hypothetical protein